MKKLLPLLLVLTVTGAAFAELGFSVEADFLPELTRFTVPLDDFANINNDDLYRGAGTLD